MFTHLNGEHGPLAVEPSFHDGRLRLPGRTSPVSAGEYAALLQVLRKGLPDMELSADWVDSLLSLLESCTANVPSSTYTGESPDVSLYGPLKMTAAVGACISEYLLEAEETDYKARLFDHEGCFLRGSGIFDGHGGYVRYSAVHVLYLNSGKIGDFPSGGMAD